MPYSAKHKNKKKTYNLFEKHYIEKNIQRANSYKRESSKKDKSQLTMVNINYKFFQNNLSNSSINTNISLIKDDKTENYLNDSYPIIPISEDNFGKNFIQKRKKIYKPLKIFNNKIISFQNQKDKQILDFPLFDDRLIFKHINKSYLQDEYSDDGSESSDEKINNGKMYLTQELKDSIKQISNNLKKKQNLNILSRRMRFKNENI